MTLKGSWRRQDWSSALRDANMMSLLGVEGGEVGAGEVKEEAGWVDEDVEEVVGGDVGVLGTSAAGEAGRGGLSGGFRKTAPQPKTKRKSRAKGPAATTTVAPGLVGWNPPVCIDGLYACEQCGRTYKRKDSLRRHLQWECGKEPQFQCPFCPQRSKRKAHQIRHIRRLHKEELIF